MQASRVLRSGMPTGKRWSAWWGQILTSNEPAVKQKGIIVYSLANNRVKPFDHLFTESSKYFWIRGRTALLWWVVPLVSMYGIIGWANEHNEFVNSKHGKAQGYAP